MSIIDIYKNNKICTTNDLLSIISCEIKNGNDIAIKNLLISTEFYNLPKSIIYKIMRSNLDLLLKKIGNTWEFDDFCKTYIEITGDSEIVIENLNVMLKYLNGISLTDFYNWNNEQDKKISTFLCKKYRTLFNLYDACPNELKYDFMTYFMYNVILCDCDNYIDKNMYKLDSYNNQNKSYEYLNMSYSKKTIVFKFGQFVIKLSKDKKSFNTTIVNHRINQPIIKKCFSYVNRQIFIEVEPFGETKEIYEADLNNVIGDLNQANILWNDQHKDNIAVVNYDIPCDIFRDIDGDIINYKSPESESYQLKKVKVIDREKMSIRNK